jgi:hypothetical protein
VGVAVEALIAILFVGLILALTWRPAETLIVLLLTGVCSALMFRPKWRDSYAAYGTL